MPPSDDIERSAQFLARAIGDRSSDVQRRAYLEAGPEAVATLESGSAVRFAPRAFHPDYMAEIEGSAIGNRAIETVEFDGKKLGAAMALVRPQSEEFTVFGGMMLAREDIPAFSRVARAPLHPATWPLVVRAGLRFARHISDRMRFPRSTRLTMGNALVGRLLQTLLERDAVLALGATVEGVALDGGRVARVRLRQGGTTREIGVGRALIAATGGFNRHPKRRSRLLPEVPIEWSAIAPGATGGFHDILDGLGARYGPVGESAAFWAPVSLPPRSRGGAGVYPHFALDRAKPGFIVVDSAGDRFLNESTSYHRFGLAMQAHSPTAPPPSFLIADDAAVRRYGIGAVRPGGWGRRRRLRDGYLISAPTLDALAEKLGMEPGRLTSSVDRLNEFARTGVDTDFGRGTTVYEKTNGDATHTPNPSIGVLTRGPFSAIRLYPGDIGASTGYVVDENARVLGPDDRPIAGLYAIGNDMQSVMADRYPGRGVTLGPQSCSRTSRSVTPSAGSAQRRVTTHLPCRTTQAQRPDRAAERDDRPTGRRPNHSPG